MISMILKRDAAASLFALHNAYDLKRKVCTVSIYLIPSVKIGINLVVIRSGYFE